jgi:hypothetical protein
MVAPAGFTEKATKTATLAIRGLQVGEVLLDAVRHREHAESHCPESGHPGFGLLGRIERQFRCRGETRGKTRRRLGDFDDSFMLGAGGMGEVWRASDTRFGREVVLKVGPPDLAHDPERHARFEREVPVLASVNHLNTATLFGLACVDGQHVLVMEPVEGEGLDDRVARGPIPLDEAIPLALQIAEGLEAAHEAGVVHRGLEPGNIRIREVT